MVDVPSLLARVRSHKRQRGCEEGLGDLPPTSCYYSALNVFAQYSPHTKPMVSRTSHNLAKKKQWHIPRFERRVHAPIWAHSITTP